MIQSLLMLIPTEAYLPLMVIAGLMMIIGMRKIAMTIITSVLAMAILGPFIDALINSLPYWAVFLLMMAFFLSLFRLLLGGRIFDHVMALIVYDLIRAPFRLLLWLLGAAILRRR